MKTLYTAEALASGEGRDGNARTQDGKLNVTLASPVELGGTGEGTNPEQLFAAGYAACFHSALRLVGRKEQADLTDSAVAAKIHFGALPDGAGYGLAAELEIAAARPWTGPPRRPSWPRRTRSARTPTPPAAT